MKKGKSCLQIQIRPHPNIYPTSFLSYIFSLYHHLAPCNIYTLLWTLAWKEEEKNGEEIKDKNNGGDLCDKGSSCETNQWNEKRNIEYLPWIFFSLFIFLWQKRIFFFFFTFFAINKFFSLSFFLPSSSMLLSIIRKHSFFRHLLVFTFIYFFISIILLKEFSSHERKIAKKFFIINIINLISSK